MARFLQDAGTEPGTAPGPESSRRFLRPTRGPEGPHGPCHGGFFTEDKRMLSRTPGDGGGIEIYSTCPQSTDASGPVYRELVARTARWSEAHGCTGALIYSDNRLVDPWLVAQLLIEETEALAPLVAVQPAYMHPYAAATMVASLAHLHGRRMVLNLVAGGFRNDLVALGDPTPHERRYERLTEFGTIVRDLVAGEAPVTLRGEFYGVEGLTLSPAVDPELRPDLFVSGSSPAGRRAAEILSARPVSYPGPPHEELPPADSGAHMPGLRVGIIARETADEAWELAHRRFPPDRKGQVRHQLARKVSDSVWHRRLSERADRESRSGCYWLVPFENYKTMCPYLVGSHDEVAREVSGYLALGYGTFILDIPRAEADLAHAREVFRRAEALAFQSA